jgi:hypothetical protein
MKTLLPLLLAILILTSCSHQVSDSGTVFTAPSLGIIENKTTSFPIYLTNTLEKRIELEKKYSNNIFIIHTGHVLKAKLSKEENEKILFDLIEQNYNLINLTQEDFLIANNQGISLESFDKLLFLNSSVIDLNQDALVSSKNITSMANHEDVTFIGLSDSNVDETLEKDRFIIGDYVLSLLKAKVFAQKSDAQQTPKSIIIIHTLGKEFDEVMLRLPSSFISSLAN